MLKKITEIITDYTSDDNLTHIDAYFSKDPNESGKTIAVVCRDTCKVIFFDNAYQLDEKVKDAIRVVLSELNNDLIKQVEVNLTRLTVIVDNGIKALLGDDLTINWSTKEDEKGDCPLVTTSRGNCSVKKVRTVSGVVVLECVDKNWDMVDIHLSEVPVEQKNKLWLKIREKYNVK
jgi:hypothetical protein